MGNSLPRNICVMLKYHLGMNEAQFIFINCNFSKLVFGRMARQLLAYNYINNRLIYLCVTPNSEPADVAAAQREGRIIRGSCTLKKLGRSTEVGRLNVSQGKLESCSRPCRGRCQPSLLLTNTIDFYF